MTHDLLDDLLADVPRHVVPDPSRAWRTGTGRRRRRVLLEGLVVAAAVVLVVLGLVRVNDRSPVGPADGTTGVDGHPSRVWWPWGAPALPDRPGPVAGVVAWSDIGWSSAKQLHFSLVDARGRSWVLSDAQDEDVVVPSLSDDGRRVAYVRADRDGGSTFVLRDLVTGERREFPEIGTGQRDAVEPYRVVGGSYWSPDGRAVVIEVATRADAVARPVLLTMDGRMSELGVSGFPAGWRDEERVVLFRRSGVVLVTDTSGAVVGRSRLAARPERGFVRDGVRLSPDGSRIAFSAVAEPAARLHTWAFSVDTGELVLDEGGWQVNDLLPDPVWDDDRVLVWDGDGLVDSSSGDRVVSFVEQWPEVVDVTWASDSFAGPAKGGLGLRDWRYWPVWWWWEQLAVLGGVCLFIAWVWWLERRGRAPRRRRT